VPANFFSVLTSPNREIYYDALMILHETFKFELNIPVNDFIASIISILEDRKLELEEDDDEAEINFTPSGDARRILKRFLKTGWIDREFINNSFVEIITPRNYAIPVLKLLAELGDITVKEYNSLVFATFSGLKQAMSEEEPHIYEALLSAKSNTEELQYSLRTLFHGIRGFLRGIVNQHDVNLLLQDHFGEFKKMSDRIYHPIKTLDSIHRYMSPIQTILTDILANDELLKSMRERAILIRNHKDKQHAQDEIIHAIDYIMDSYNTVGYLISEIDRKHSNYTKSSIEKIKYLMTADQSIQGKLAEALKLYAKADDNKREVLADIMENKISASRQYFFDSGSLYHKNIKGRRTNQPPLKVEQNSELSEIAERYLLRQISESFSSSRIRAFINNLFREGNDKIEAKHIALNEDTDFILLILAVIRQDEKGMPYSIEVKDTRIEINGYSIPDMVIYRRSATNVE